MKLSKIVLGAVAAFALAATATAASADGRDGLKDAPRPFSWTGFYAGLDLGGASGDSSVVWDGFPLANSKPNLHGVIGGGHLGYNAQVGQFVLGIEVSGGKGPRGSALVPSERSLVDVESLVQVVGRVGYAWHRTMLYGLGGYAGGSVEHVEQNLVSTNRIFDSQWHNGWVGGVGLSHALHPNVVVGLEYRHVDLGSDRYDSTNNFGGSGFGRKVDTDFDLIQARVSVKFN